MAVLRSTTILWLVIISLASCSESDERRPRNISDICSIFNQRPSWEQAAFSSEKKWNIPLTAQMAIIRQESGFRAHARPPESYLFGIFPHGQASSAYGYAQAIDGTWEWYQRDTKKPESVRSRFADSIDFVGWYMAKSKQRLKLSDTDVTAHYLAYHEGHAGFGEQSYQEKKWLGEVAEKVARIEESYRQQLAKCRNYSFLASVEDSSPTTGQPEAFAPVTEKPEATNIPDIQ